MKLDMENWLNLQSLSSKLKHWVGTSSLHNPCPDLTNSGILMPWSWIVERCKHLFHQKVHLFSKCLWPENPSSEQASEWRRHRFVPVGRVCLCRDESHTTEVPPLIKGAVNSVSMVPTKEFRSSSTKLIPVWQTVYSIEVSPAAGKQIPQHTNWSLVS